MKYISNFSEIEPASYPFFNKVHFANEFSAPVRHVFNVEIFSFLKLYLDGSIVFFTNAPELVYEAIKSGIYARMDLYRKISTISEEYVAGWVPDERIKHKLIFQEGFDYIKPVVDGWECYHFSTTKQAQNVSTLYLDDLILLNKFVINNQESIDKLLLELDSYRIKNINIDMTKMLAKQPQKCQSALGLNKVNFLSDVYGCKLTPRELDYVKLLREGKTAKGIAENLKLSYRTVEEYLRKLRDKTNVNSTLELIQKFT